MKWQELAYRFEERLIKHYDRSEIRTMLQMGVDFYLKLVPQKIELHFNKQLTLEQEEVFATLLHDLENGKPIQQILGEADFFGLKFKVNEHVLIPRPETEELVDWILQNEGIKKDQVEILDIGTGSGCIAVSLKKNLPQANVTAFDVSKQALAIADLNAQLNQASINFVEVDILDKGKHAGLLTKYSVIVSNPPYITLNEKTDMHENVLQHEPHLALFVTNNDPLQFYRAIADFALLHLKNRGKLFFEINEHYATDTISMLKEKGFISVQLRQDMQGKDRMLSAEREKS